MRTFNSLQEFIDYVPNCLICNKELIVSLSSTLHSVEGKHKRWASGREALNVRFEKKEGLLHSKHKSYKISIKLDDNSILEGGEVMSRITSDSTFVRKNCPTCHLKIATVCSGSDLKKGKRFSDLTLRSEELHFTMKGGKDLSVEKQYPAYGNPPWDTVDGDTANIRLNHKFLPPVPFDFNKFNSFEQLIRRIQTIVLFH